MRGWQVGALGAAVVGASVLLGPHAWAAVITPRPSGEVIAPAVVVGADAGTVARGPLAEDAPGTPVEGSSENAATTASSGQVPTEPSVAATGDSHLVPATSTEVAGSSSGGGSTSASATQPTGAPAVAPTTVPIAPGITTTRSTTTTVPARTTTGTTTSRTTATSTTTRTVTTSVQPAPTIQTIQPTRVRTVNLSAERETDDKKSSDTSEKDDD